MACVSKLLQYCPGEWRSAAATNSFRCSVWTAALLRAGWGFAKQTLTREHGTRAPTAGRDGSALQGGRQRRRQQCRRGQMRRSTRSVPGAPSKARQNRSDGGLFWGCQQYPKCKATRPMPGRLTPKKIAGKGPQSTAAASDGGDSWAAAARDSWAEVPAAAGSAARPEQQLLGMSGPRTWRKWRRRRRRRILLGRKFGNGP